MKTILDPEQKNKQLVRLQRLHPDTIPRWGRLTAGNLLPHLTDPFRIALGEFDVQPVRSFISTPLGRFMAIFLMPCWPKGAPTNPKTDISKEGRKGKVFEQDRQELVEVIERFIVACSSRRFHEHPMFGKLSNKTWGMVMNKHLDHHFRQFNI